MLHNYLLLVFTLIKNTTSPTFYGVTLVSNLLLPNDKKIGQFYQSFCSVYTIKNLPQNNIPENCINDTNFHQFLQERALAKYFFETLNEQPMPNFNYNPSVCSYDSRYCFINYNAFDIATDIKTLYINIFKCSGQLAGAGMILLFELLLEYYKLQFVKVELLAQPFLTQSDPGPERVEDCQISLDRCYINAGFEMKNPSSDPNDKFNNEFEADIKKVLKTIIYRVMMMDCELFKRSFILPDDCECPPEPPRGGLKKRKSKKRRKSIKKNNMKRKTKRRRIQRKKKK